MIKDLNDGAQVYGRFLVADCKKCVSNSQKNYLALTLQDATGTMEARKWEILDDDEDVFSKGQVVYVVGSVLLYGNKLQMKVTQGEKVDPSLIDWSAYIPSAPVPQQILENKLNVYFDSFEDPDVKNLIVKMVEKYKEKYLLWPAAMRNHHAFVSGLLFHSLTMADLASKACKIYSTLNRDIMIGGALIHDIGKVMELSGPNGTFYTLQGRLLGHLTIGQAELRETAKEMGYYAFLGLPKNEQELQEKQNSPFFHRYEIALQFEHILISHHGKHEYGAAMLPQTREALAISMIDDFDSKMLILDNAYRGLNPGDVTSKIMSLDDRYFYLPRSSVSGKPYGTSVEEQLEDLKK
ncbi:MAG: 3'-5' exoribonuclease YhaM family protein [Candidatus Enteromonas sp.]